MVGSYIRGIFKEEEVCLTGIAQLDITDYQNVQNAIEKVKPDVVLHLAAATDVDRCEVQPDWAFKVNVLGTQNLVWTCQQKNILLVYVSTGGVFDGRKKDIHTEFDSPSPVNVYAQSKWEAEKIVQQLNRYFIVRAGWMIGGGKKDKKFVGKMVEMIRTKEEIHAVNDKLGTLTYAKDLLQIIHMLIQTPFYGIYHAANKGLCTRYDVALEIKKLLKSSTKIHPASSGRFPLPAPRSHSEAICNYKLELMRMNCMPSWQEALGTCLQEWLPL